LKIRGEEENFLQLVAQIVGFEKELKEHLVLGFSKLLAATDHLGAIGTGREGWLPRVLLKAAAEVPRQTRLPLLIRHDFATAGKELPVRLLPVVVRRPNDLVPHILQQLQPSRGVAAVQGEVGDLLLRHLGALVTRHRQA